VGASLNAAAARPEPARLSSCTAFVPVHDEVASIVAVAEGLLAVLPEVAASWDLVLVDDGSRDGTAALVDRLAATRSNVRVVRHATNRGYGAAVRSGLAAARGEWVFFTDGDGQFDPAVLREVAACAGDADVVVGVREVRADPWRRRVFTRGWNVLVRRLLGVPVRDVNCAVKLFRRSVLDGIDARADGGAISAELLAHLVRRRARVIELPVAHHPRRAGRASGGRPGVALRACAELAMLWWRLRP
jgi:glycosyltransferase involved in cell wall biosynthesis